jgi:hypothetical protein
MGNSILTPDIKKDFDSLLENIKDLYNQEELEQIRLTYSQMKSSGKAKAKLIREIVPIREWLDDYYYVGPDVDNVYPFWKEKMVEVFDRPLKEKINQIILTGAIGIGKTTFASLVIIRTIYELSCYEHIAALFKLFGVSRIAFAYLSVTKAQAMNTGFSLLVEWIDSIPYFRETFKRKQGIDSMVIWPKERLIITYGSVANHFIGLNLLGSILDEANFFGDGNQEAANYKMNSKVANLYTQIITRSQSRFIVGGINYSLSILVSSSTVETSFTEERIDKSKHDPHTLVVSPSLWEVKPGEYSGEKFFVYTGGESIDPMVINDIEDFNMILSVRKLPLIDNSIKLKEAYTLLPPTIQANVMEVPVEHKTAFQDDIITTLQNLAGYSVSSSGRLFTSNVAYNNCIDENNQHPFSKKEIVLSTTKEPRQEGYIPLKSYMFNDVIFENKHMPRYMHLDLALTGDSLGMSMCHISGWKSIYKTESNFEQLPGDSDEIEDEIKIPVITFDFIIKVVPPKKPNKISLSKVRDFILFLRNHHGIKFGKITADQFQSEQLLQELDELKFDIGRLSVDRTPDAYISFTNLLYESRVKLYDYKPFKDELFSVIYYPAKKKVDHPAGGSKDVADSVVGSAYNAIKAEDKSDVTDHSLLDLFSEANLSDRSQEDAIRATIGALENMLKNS